VAQQAWRAWRHAERVFDEAVWAEAAAEQSAIALGLFRPEGALNDRQWAQAQLHGAIEQLAGPAWGKTRRLLKDQRTLAHLDWVHAQLAQAVEDTLLRDTLARLWSLRQAMAPAPHHQHIRLAKRVMMEEVVCQRLWAQWGVAYARVDEMLGRVMRASSAVEGLNSVLRMHQARHRHVSQDMLDLKRRYWNCRSFRHGQRKAHCPYELLGLKLPTYDWWTLLQMDPQALEQKLLTQEVMP